MAPVVGGGQGQDVSMWDWLVGLVALVWVLVISWVGARKDRGHDR
jgi:4-hydroxybenzoate polyprenyltransferase